MKKMFSKLFVITFTLFNFLPLFLTQASADSVEEKNLIANPGMEIVASGDATSPQDWLHGGWGANVGTYSYLTTGYSGNRSVKVELTSITDGDLKWFFSPVTVSPNTQYTYRDFYKANIASELVYQVEDSKGNLSYYYLDSPVANAASWTETAVNLITPADAKKLTVFHLIYEVGWLIIDDASLVQDTLDTSSLDPEDNPLEDNPDGENPGNNPGNLVANSSVENASSPNSSLPQKWLQDRWGTNQATFSYLDNGYSGSRSVKVEMISRTDGDAKWYFNPVAVAPNTEYTFSDYYQSNIPTYVVAQVDNGSGMMQYLYIGEAAASPQDWQNFSGTFTTPVNTRYATVFHVVERTGWLITDDFSLTRETVVAPLPTIDVVNPTVGAVLTGTINVEANATDKDGVASVQFQLNGVNLGYPLVQTPYIYSWDTSAVLNGAYSLTAIVTNIGGSSAISDIITISINNEITDSEPVEKNLIANPSLETPDLINNTKPQGWFEGGWGANERTYEYLSTGHNDAASIKVTMNSHVDGDVKWYFAPIEVTPNTTYIFSDFYRSSVPTELISQIEDTDGNLTYEYLAGPAASADVWSQTIVSFTTPTNAKRLTIFHLIAQVGWLITDDYSLIAEKQEEASTDDIILNPSMETANPVNSSLPLGWTSGKWGENSAKFSYLTTGYSGNRSLKVELSDYANGDAKWVHTPSDLVPGADYRFTDYYQSNVVTHIIAMVTMVNGSVKYFDLANAEPAAFWTQYSDTFTVPADAKEVVILHLISRNGWLITDDYSITPYHIQGFSRALVSLTFDDGWEDNCKTALPIMSQYGFLSSQYYATIFIENPENPYEECRIQNFAAAGHEVGSHTVTHPFLTQLTPERLAYELAHSKEYLESQLGEGTIVGFASPYGDFDARVITEIKKYYTYHRGVQTGYNSLDNFDLFSIRVQNMLSSTTQAEFEEWLRRAEEDKTWLVLVYHRVAEDPGQYDTATSDFAAQMKALYQSGLTVKTVGQALGELIPQVIPQS